MSCTTEKRSESGSDPGERAKARRPWVLLDTNAILLPIRRRFPLESEVYRRLEGAEIRVPGYVRAELKALSTGPPGEAELALRYANRFPTVESTGSGDEAMVDLARRTRSWVVTGDRELRRRLTALGVGVLFPRGRSHLEVSPGARSSRSSRRSKGARRSATVMT